MKKKVTFLAVLAIVLLICIITFFKPLLLSDIINEKNQITMVFCEFGVKNGEAYIDSVDYQSINEEQKSSVLDVMGIYPYRKTPGTLFSSGSVSEIGDKVLYIYVYDDSSLVSNAVISSSGKIAVNEKNYNMKNAEQFIEQILEIVE